MESNESLGSEKHVDVSPPSIQTNLLTFIAKQSYREMWEERFNEPFPETPTE